MRKTYKQTQLTEPSVLNFLLFHFPVRSYCVLTSKEKKKKSQHSSSVKPTQHKVQRQRQFNFPPIFKNTGKEERDKRDQIIYASCCSQFFVKRDGGTMNAKQNPLKSCECFNGKIKRFSCNFNIFSKVLIHGFSCGKFHEKSIKNPMKLPLKPLQK